MRVFFSAVIDDFLLCHPHIERILIAYSGGVDSQVLLHGLAAYQSEKKSKGESFPKLQAIHVNHGLNDNADQWQSFCAQQCQQLQIPLKTNKLQLDCPLGESLEAYAREARYNAFNSLMTENVLLLMGHHQDDQIETLFIRLLRGSGVRGLAAMPVSRPMASGWLLRPMLYFPRSRLESYAQKHHLQWIEDDSNKDERFDRNFLRHQLLPLLEQRWPAYRTTIERSANHCSTAWQLIHDEIAKDYLQCYVENGCFSLHFLKALPVSRRMMLISYCVEQATGCLTDSHIVSRINAELIESNNGQDSKVYWRDWQFRCFKEQLYILPKLAAMDRTQTFSWKVKERNSYQLPNGVISATEVSGAGLLIPKDGVLIIAYRQGGERCHPASRQHSTSLKKWLQEVQVPPWEKEYLPLIQIGAELVAVADLCICKGYEAKKGQKGLKFTWHLNPAPSVE